MSPVLAHTTALLPQETSRERGMRARLEIDSQQLQTSSRDQLYLAFTSLLHL